MTHPPSYDSAGEPEPQHDIGDEVGIPAHEATRTPDADTRTESQGKGGDTTQNTGDIRFPSWYDGSYVTAAGAAVPEIGSCRSRWYDLPYIALKWCVGPTRSKFLPRWLRAHIYRWITILIRC
jgi:hypothetical protein